MDPGLRHRAELPELRAGPRVERAGVADAADRARRRVRADQPEPPGGTGHRHADGFEDGAVPRQLPELTERLLWAGPGRTAASTGPTRRHCQTKMASATAAGLRPGRRTRGAARGPCGRGHSWRGTESRLLGVGASSSVAGGPGGSSTSMDQRLLAELFRHRGRHLGDRRSNRSGARGPGRRRTTR